ncbi:hypothetical protein WH95_18440 [Kiloniella litopenaei]|uniref:Cytosine-specific methyltransferase n=1 Tax=Kiloniella litopenaei TaxID=1549748 RepID=A0A0M2R1A0_9PROT|nr:DNA cytosine methyltransferase [Kiloniella litopenaei]KKJ75421.1 hypothetical protein WH95_18440 [Kiloniella litopenaei]
MLKVLDIFSGIGGFSLGLERTGGFETVAFCEIEDYPRKVLAKHWPDVPIYRDVRNVNAKQLITDGIAVDIVTGGFPCQDLSIAGKQAGIEAERSGLWSELCRIIGEVRPKYAIVENVTNLLSGPDEQPGEWFGRVLADLAEIGYDAEWYCIPASCVGAPHQRDRVWIVAYPKCPGLQGFISFRSTFISTKKALAFNSNKNSRAWASLVGGELILRSGDGVSVGMERVRIKSLGNAVHPLVPEWIGYAILEAETARYAEAAQ